jgi:putative transposase
MAARAVAHKKVSIALACRTFGVSETCYRYSAKLCDENQEIADRLLGLTKARRTWGFGLCFLYLRNVKGHAWNHKRVYRIYRELELNLRVSHCGAIGSSPMANAPQTPSAGQARSLSRADAAE